VFVLKKIAGALLIPPGLFSTALAATAAYFLLRKDKLKKPAALLLGLAALVWVMSITPVADILTRSLEGSVPAPRDPKGDVVIVLYGTGQRLSPALSLSSQLKVPLVLCGFNYLRNNPAEEARLRSSLQDYGLAPDQVIIESRSRDTIENIRAAGVICREREFRNPLLVTSAFHARRVRLTCRKLDFRALVVPVSFTVLGRAIHYTWRDALPLAENMYGVSLALNEYLGLLFYQVAY
jgi:uncharacterized SAM-binding protein YcdF (DUF218 family)